VLRGEATWDELYAGAVRYGNHCRATSRMVMNPAKFFGDVDRPWTHDWAIPVQKGKPGAAPAPNNDAAWAEAKARAKAIGFRDPQLTEPVGAYMTSVKLAETTRLETPACRAHRPARHQADRWGRVSECAQSGGSPKTAISIASTLSAPLLQVPISRRPATQTFHGTGAKGGTPN